MAVPDDASEPSSLALQNLNAILELDSVVTAKYEALGCVRSVGETHATSLTSWTLEKTDMVLDRDERSAEMEHLDIDWTEL